MIAEVMAPQPVNSGNARCVVVGNPGSIPEIVRMATAIDSAGMLRQYISPFAIPDAWWLLGMRGTAGRVARPLVAELGRRVVPRVDRERLAMVASTREALFVAAQRVRLRDSTRSKLLWRRNYLFDRRLSERLVSGDRALISAYGAAVATLQRAKDLRITSFLEYPIAHHAFAQRILAEEARRQPRFAPTLQFHTFPEAIIRRLDLEIAIADRVLVLSNFQRETFLADGVPADKLILTHLGVDPEVFYPQPRDIDGTFRVMFCGQITQRKGISYLLEAFRLAGIRRSELLLVGSIVGDSVPWHPSADIRHIAWVPRSELPKLYRTADVFVLPSLVEGFPQTALEAMACGVPVIVSENTFGSDVIHDEENGFIVPIRDAPAIAQRLCELAADAGLRQRIGQEARSTAERFSWDAYGERVIRVLEEFALDA